MDTLSPGCFVVMAFSGRATGSGRAQLAAVAVQAAPGRPPTSRTRRLPTQPGGVRLRAAPPPVGPRGQAPHPHILNPVTSDPPTTPVTCLGTRVGSEDPHGGTRDHLAGTVVTVAPVSPPGSRKASKQGTPCTGLVWGPPAGLPGRQGGRRKDAAQVPAPGPFSPAPSQSPDLSPPEARSPANLPCQVRGGGSAWAGQGKGTRLYPA